MEVGETASIRRVRAIMSTHCHALLLISITITTAAIARHGGQLSRRREETLVMLVLVLVRQGSRLLQSIQIVLLAGNGIVEAAWTANVRPFVNNKKKKKF